MRRVSNYPSIISSPLREKARVRMWLFYPITPTLSPNRGEGKSIAC